MDRLLLTAPIGGWLMALSEVPDAAFAGGMIGEGAAIDPLDGTLCAPCDATVSSIAKGRHALTLRAGNGAEILIHVGIDTVEANGAGLTIRVESGQEVKRGDTLIEVALDELLDHARSLVTPVVIINARDYAVARCGEPGRVQAGAPFLELSRVASKQPEATQDAAGATSSESVTVALPHGVHARPAAEIVRLSRSLSSRVTLIAHGRRAEAQSMTALMGLGAGHGDRITVEGTGPDSPSAVRAVAAILTTPTLEPGTPAGPRPVSTAAGDDPARSATREGEIRGIVASRGLAVGCARKLRRAQFLVAEKGEGIEREREALRRALRKAAGRLRSRAAGHDIFAAQLELLEDPALVAEADAAIDGGKSAGFAWQSALAGARGAFTTFGDPLIAERVADLRDIEDQVLLALSGADATATIELAEDTILLADDLLPSEFGRLDLDKLAGICCAGGGPTSHVALMAAARGIPTLVGAGRGLLDIDDGTPLLLDAERGTLLANPADATIAGAREAIAGNRRRRAAAVRDAARDAMTADGVRIEVFANLASEAEARDAVGLGAEGCGLLRTELLYLDRRSAPDEDEQADRYQAIAKALGNRPLVIRTLDVGGDKPLPYLPLPAEENPLLGLRGLRACLQFPEILETQLAAILRVVPPSQCRVLLPMVTEPAEIRSVRRLLDSLVAARGLRTGVPVGAMIETPASVALADAIAREADFLSIGSNDLAQYTLAMDRSHPVLASRFDHFHPAVLRQIAAVCEAGANASRNVSVCGALASEPAAVPILLGLGVRTLSVVPTVLPELKALIRRLTLAACEETASRVLATEDAAVARRIALEPRSMQGTGT